VNEDVTRLPDGSGFMVVELTDPKDHPLRQQATSCVECQTKAVFFNSGNVDVACHACGTQEGDLEVRQFHLGVWVRAAVLS
jgi:hypothetical protein